MGYPVLGSSSYPWAPNKSFKPNLLRYSKSVAEKACHAFASTTQVGLTQVLGSMSKYFAAAILVLLSSCSTVPERKLTETEIVALTEKLSYEYCHSGSSSGYPKVGCEFNALFLDNTWSVIAHSIYRNAKGETLGVMGADMLYVFSPSGKLLRTLPGM